MTKDNKKSPNELLNDIAARIHAISNVKISEQKAREGARRFIQLCQKLIDIEIRIETEKERKNENQQENEIQ